MNKDGVYPITVWGFSYDNELKRTYSHNSGLPENFGLLLKNQLIKYNDINKIKNRFEKIIMIDPYSDIISINKVNEMIDKKYIDDNELINNAMRLHINVNGSNIDNIKTNWFNLLNQWVNLGIKPYIEYDTPYMIDYDLVYEEINSPVNFDYLIDLDNEELVISGMSDTSFSFEELNNMDDNDFLDIIYNNENSIIFKGELF